MARAVVPSREPAPGDLIAGKFVLRERLGAGGMGVVFCAEQLLLGRTVAVKLLHRDLVADPEIAGRFAEEARTASRFSHRNAVAMIDSGVTDDGVPYLVMEHIHGETLTALLRREGQLDVERAVGIVAQILAALEDAHAAGIIHADIKSDNVLVETLRTGLLLVKVVDFGLARATSSGGGPARAAVVCGTPDYMAPELVSGAAPSAASDLYAAGVILYELITGETPFGGGEPAEVLVRQVADVVVPPSLRRPDRVYSRALERVVQRALEKDPRARFADAAELAAALDDAVPALDPERSRRCVACGALAPVRSRFCPECGAAADAQPPRPCASSAEIVTRNLVSGSETAPPRPRGRVARGSQPLTPPPADREAALRDELRDAIAQGAIDRVAGGYVALARSLVSARRSRDAVRELEEGVDVVTAGAGPDQPCASGRLWQMLVALAALYDALGDRGKARRTAAWGYQQAVANRSIVGRDRTLAIIERLAHTE